MPFTPASMKIGLWMNLGGAGITASTPRGINRDIGQHGYEWLGTDACPYAAAAQRVGSTRLCFWLPAGSEGWGSFDLASFTRLEGTSLAHLTPQAFAEGAAALIRRCPLVTDVDVYLGFVLAHPELWGNVPEAQIELAKRNLFAVHLLKQLVGPLVRVHPAIDTLGGQFAGSPTRTIAIPAVAEWDLGSFVREPWPHRQCPDLADPGATTVVNEDFISKLSNTWAAKRSDIKGDIWPFMIGLGRPRLKAEYLRTAGRALNTFGRLFVEPVAPVTKAELLTAAMSPLALQDAHAAYPPLVFN